MMISRNEFFAPFVLGLSLCALVGCSAAPRSQSEHAGIFMPGRTVHKGAYVKLKPIDGRPGFYMAGDRMMDMRGFPSGTEVRDPDSGEIFLVP
jgi:hypothetical protein